MINLTLGVILLIVTAAMYVWVLPNEEQRPRIAGGWNMTSVLQLAVMCLGLAGLILVAKSIYS